MERERERESRCVTKRHGDWSRELLSLFVDHFEMFRANCWSLTYKLNLVMFWATCRMKVQYSLSFLLSFCSPLEENISMHVYLMNSLSSFNSLFKCSKVVVKLNEAFYVKLTWNQYNLNIAFIEHGKDEAIPLNSCFFLLLFFLQCYNSFFFILHTLIKFVQTESRLGFILPTEWKVNTRREKSLSF